MACNITLRTHCYYDMYNKKTEEIKTVMVTYPFTASKARERCTSNVKLQKDWKVIGKGF